jgi:anti-sigma factor RsiW
MSTERQFPDEMLMAFADGELDAAETEAVARAIETDPEVAGRVATFMATRNAVRGAFGRIVSQRPPDRLFNTVMGTPETFPRVQGQREAGSAPPFESPANENRRPPAWRPIALAASFAAAVAGGAGYVFGTRGIEPGSALAVVATTPEAIATLLSAPAEGQATPLVGPSATGTVTGTYRLREGRICRSFEVRHAPSNTGAEALGCRDAGNWRITVAMPRAGADGVFRPASGDATIDAFLDAGGAGPALSRTDVEALARAGWR